MNQEIHKSKLRAGNRTYFFDVKVVKTENLYLEITESKKQEVGTFARRNIMIFEEDMKHFKNEISELYERFFKDK